VKSESNAGSPKGDFYHMLMRDETAKWEVHDIPLYAKELLKHEGPVVMAHHGGRRVGRTHRER